jgi:hypothetical protein
MRTLSVLALAPLAALTPFALSQGQTRFTEVTSSSGIDFVHTDQVDTMAGGICFFDYDNDGYPDLFVTARGGGTNRLYHNRGNGTFEEVTTAAGVGGVYSSMGAYAADLDNDGHEDLVVLTFGTIRVYRNDKNGTFTDLSSTTGMGRGYWATAATFGDYDHDGDLDIYIGNYVFDGFFPFFDGGPNQLFRNDGNFKFIDVAKAAGVDGEETFYDPRGFIRTTHSCTLSVLFHDYDLDGWQDLLVGNDFGPAIIPNQLFRNNRDGTFSEVGASAGFRIPEFNMGLATADVNGDRIPDIYTTNLGNNHLLLNDGRGRFTDVAAAWNVREGTSNGLLLTSWACMFLDADVDALPDLYVSNGLIETIPALANDPNAPSRLLYHLGRSYMITPEPLFPWDKAVGRGAACADIDGDGDEDIVQLNNRARLRVYRNDCVTSYRSVTIDLRGTLSNRNAIGSLVTLRSTTFTQVREYVRGGSYISCNGAPMVMGFGGDREVAEATVRWPGGIESHVFGLAGNRRHEIVEPAVTITSVGPIRPFFSDCVECQITVRNHSSQPEPVTFEAALSLQQFDYRGSFPIYHHPVTVGANGTATVTVYLPIPAAVIPYGRSLGTWIGFGVRSAAGGLDQREVPL